MLVTVVAQITAKTVNLEKANYVLSLMFSSINKLKSHMLFACKSVMFSDFTWKKNFAPGNGAGLAAPCRPFFTALGSMDSPENLHE